MGDEHRTLSLGLQKISSDVEFNKICVIIYTRINNRLVTNDIFTTKKSYAVGGQLLSNKAEQYAHETKKRK